MNPLLTIGLPTFNRADLLEAQLAWLSKAIKGNESKCEIIISDNCSTDRTQEVIEKWKPHFKDAKCRIERQNENIGAVRNISYCINSAQGKYVWTISDDDEINNNTLNFVLQSLEENQDLSLIILNFSLRDAKDGKLKKNRWFEIEKDEVNPDGKSVFERLWQVERGGGVQLTTALVYRTDLAQQSLREWPYSLSSLALQFYVTSFCALHGSVKITKDTHLEGYSGRHFFENDKLMLITYKFAEVPEAYIKLKKMGYSKRVCREMALRQSREIKRQQNVMKNCLMKWPLATTKVLARHIVAVGRVLFV